MNEPITLVTGGSKGIGRAVVRQLLRSGHQVITCGRNKASWEVVTSAEPELAAAHFMACDLNDSAQLEQLFATIRSRFGRLDNAVNNAASEMFMQNFIDIDPADALEQLHNNLWMPMVCLHHELKLMRDGGSIVNLSSVAAYKGARDATIYGAAKRALEGVTCSLALRCIERGIRVNAVAPGVVYTERWQERVRKSPLGEALLTNIEVPIKRFATPEEIAEPICWLLSPAASYVVGHTMIVDGGLVLL